jgi:hypothetical protein
MDNNGKRGFRGNVYLAAWGPGDVFLALSLTNWSGIEVQQSLIDGSQRSFPSIGCHYCEGITSSLRVDGDSGMISFQGLEAGWANLFDRSIGSDAAAKPALTLVPRQSWEAEITQPSEQQQKLFDRREQLTKQISSKMLAGLARAFFVNSAEFLRPPGADRSEAHPEENWKFPGSVRVSHLCHVDDDGKCAGRLVDWQEGLTELEKRNALLSKLLVKHKTLAPSASTHESNLSLTSADARLINIRGAGQHGESENKRVVSMEVIWHRLEQLPTRSGSHSALLPASSGKNIAVSTVEPSELATQILQSSPSTATYLKSSGGNDFEPVDDTFEGLKQEAQFIDPRSMREHASWQIGNRTYWPIRTFYDYGEASRNWLFLLRAEDNGNIKLEDFTHRLRYRVGKNSSGLDDNGNIERTGEFATAMGFGSWPLSVDKVSVAFGRYLIASGLWTIDARRWVLMTDLSVDQIVFFNRDIPEAATFHELAVTEDGATILQTNSNGHLYFHNIASGDIVLRGFDIDDELVVYDPQGYYAATPEGAQFVFLKFPGIPGYNSFQQFARTLERVRPNPPGSRWHDRDPRSRYYGSATAEAGGKSRCFRWKPCRKT